MSRSEGLCVHCKLRTAHRPRRLCFGCYNDLSVRHQYPVSSSNGARRGTANFCGEATLPSIPADAPAGSLEKVRVLEERAMLGLALHHPDDSPEVLGYQCVEGTVSEREHRCILPRRSTLCL